MELTLTKSTEVSQAQKDVMLSHRVGKKGHENRRNAIWEEEGDRGGGETGEGNEAVTMIKGYYIHT
jgi:hypothetical protein